MGKSNWWIPAGVFWVVIYALAKFVPGEVELIFGFELLNKLPQSIYILRLPNLILGLMLLGLITPITPKIFPILAAVSLGLFWIILTDLPMAIALVGTAVIVRWVISSNNQIAKIILGIWLVLITIFRYQPLPKKNWSGVVDLRAKKEFQINNFQTVVPLTVKRLVYNKYFFRLKENAEKTINFFGWERWSFPGQTDATVTRSLWNSKGLPWIYFWQIPLAIWAISRWKDIDPKVRIPIIIFGGWGIVLMNIGNPDIWLANGAGFILAVLILVAETYSKVDVKMKYVVWILLLVFAIPNWWHFLTNETEWRDNRPGIQTQMAHMAIKYQAGQVTTLLGGSRWYYRWLNNNQTAGVVFDHFEKPVTPGVYIGLPGEFLGSRADKNSNSFNASELDNRYQVLESIKIHDTVSFGNGDYIWAVKII